MRISKNADFRRLNADPRRHNADETQIRRRLTTGCIRLKLRLRHGFTGFLHRLKRIYIRVHHGFTRIYTRINADFYLFGPNSGIFLFIRSSFEYSIW